MNISSKWRRNRTIKHYIQKLPSLLTRDYGGAVECNPEQVRATMQRHDLNMRWLHFALAMFCKRAAFVKFYDELGATRDYDALRDIVADQFFDGNVGFTVMHMR